MGWLRGNVFVVLLLVVLLSIKEKRARCCGRQRYSAIVRAWEQSWLTRPMCRGGGGVLLLYLIRESRSWWSTWVRVPSAWGRSAVGGRGGLC